MESPPREPRKSLKCEQVDGSIREVFSYEEWEQLVYSVEILYEAMETIAVMRDAVKKFFVDNDSSPPDEQAKTFGDRQSGQ
jgi:hypothetical protein